MASCDDADSDYPAGKSYDSQTDNQSRTNDDSGTKTWTIDLGSGNTALYDTFAIAGHNFTADGTFQIGRSGSTSHILETITMTEDAYIYYWDEPTTERYITFTASEDTSEDYLYIGVMWAGERLELGANPQIPIKILDNYNSTRVKTPGGQSLGFRNFYTRGYEMTFIVDFFPSMYNALKEMHDDRGRTKPFFFNLAPQDSNDSVFFARTKSFDFNIDGKDARPGKWGVIEEK